MRDPRATYDQFSIHTWRDKVQAELRASGLPRAIQGLTTEMLHNARVNALLSEADTVIGLLQEMIIIYKCVLLRYGLPSFD